MRRRIPLLEAVMVSPSKMAEHVERMARNGTERVGVGSGSCSFGSRGPITKKLLSLDIRRDRISVAVVECGTPTVVRQHQPPRCWKTAASFTASSAVVVPALYTTPGRTIPDECIEGMYRLVLEHSVSGYLVNWPVERDTGKLGARCGRVLYTLQALLDGLAVVAGEHDGRDLFSPLLRPICLWDASHTLAETHRMDGWGRCPDFARTSKRRVYAASRERYFRYDDRDGDDCDDWDGEDGDDWDGFERRRGSVASSRRTMEPAVHVWHDFCHVHWPSPVGNKRGGGVVRSWWRGNVRPSSSPSCWATTSARVADHDDRRITGTTSGSCQNGNYRPAETNLARPAARLLLTRNF